MENQQKITSDAVIAQKLLKSYGLGFISTLILTILAYLLLTHHLLSNAGLYIALTVYLVLAIVAQIIFYFRLNTKTEDDRWNLICFLFTLLIMAIVVSGSLWIMYNLNYNMVMN